MLKSKVHSNWHYIGSSKNPKKRLKSHNQCKVRSTKGYSPFDLIHLEPYETRRAAHQKEMYYKTAKGKAELREKLIEVGVW